MRQAKNYITEYSNVYVIFHIEIDTYTHIWYDILYKDTDKSSQLNTLVRGAHMLAPT